RALQVGAGFVLLPEPAAELAVCVVHLRFGGHRMFHGPGELDRLLEEHKSGLVPLGAAQSAHQGIDLRQAPDHVPADGYLLGASLAASASRSPRLYHAWAPPHCPCASATSPSPSDAAVAPAWSNSASARASERWNCRAPAAYSPNARPI